VDQIILDFAVPEGGGKEERKRRRRRERGKEDV